MIILMPLYEAAYGLKVVMENNIKSNGNNRKSVFDDSEMIEEALAFINYEDLRTTLTGTTYDVVDFFSGCGGMSYGFHKLGERTGAFNPIGAFDKDRHANATFETNFGLKPSDMDLNEATVDEIKLRLEQGGRKPGNPLIVIGCAPCQGFSSHRKKDPRKDERNSLVGRFGEIAVELGAELIIMENVPDLLAKKHWNHYKYFASVLEENGYNISAKIINMAEFGVPQARFRAVVVASKKFIPTLPEPRFDRKSYKTVRDAIEGLPYLSAGESSAEDSMHVTSKHRKETVEIIKQVPKDGGSRPSGVGPKCLDKVAGFYDVYGRLYWDRPAVTITARCRTPSCGRFAHPEQDRGLSVREAGLLQSFPSDFIFEGPFDDKFKQIGNAVPPKFSTHLAAHILTLLSGFNHGVDVKNLSIEKPTFQSFSGSIARMTYANNQERKEAAASNNG